MSTVEDENALEEVTAGLSVATRRSVGRKMCLSKDMGFGCRLMQLLRRKDRNCSKCGCRAC